MILDVFSMSLLFHFIPNIVWVPQGFLIVSRWAHSRKRITTLNSVALEYIDRHTTGSTRQLWISCCHSFLNYKTYSHFFACCIAKPYENRSHMSSGNVVKWINKINLSHGKELMLLPLLIVTSLEKPEHFHFSVAANDKFTETCAWYRRL